MLSPLETSLGDLAILVASSIIVVILMLRLASSTVNLRMYFYPGMTFSCCLLYCLLYAYLHQCYSTSNPNLIPVVEWHCLPFAMSKLAMNCVTIIILSLEMFKEKLSHVYVEWIDVEVSCIKNKESRYVLDYIFFSFHISNDKLIMSTQ